MLNLSVIDDKMKKPRVLITYPNFHRYFVPFLPFYEPFVAILLGSLIKDIAEASIFDRRYETEGAWIKTLRSFKPDIIAVRIHTSGEMFTTRRMLEIAKKVDPNVITIIGGQHPTLLPEDFCQPCFDLICIGPAEETFPEVVKAVGEGGNFENIKGLAIRKDDKFIFTEERVIKSGVFKWPKLNRELASKYKRHFTQGITVATHGCPHRCKFCSLWFTAKGTYRLRDAEEVVDDIASLPNKHVYIADDNTFHDYKHALTIYEGLKRRGVRKFYGAYARVDTIIEHPEVFEKWKEIGLRGLVVGFEVIKNDVLDSLNKKTTVESNIKAMEFLNKLKIHCYAHFIIFPDFTLKDFRQLSEFIIRHKISEPYYVPLTPTPGTLLFKEAKENDELSIYNYGFYNLEYMVYKTKLPKWRWYFEWLRLWFGSITPIFYLRMRRYFPLPTYIWRIGIILRLAPLMLRNIVEQIIEEKTKRYKDIEETLPPSLRRNYEFRYLKNMPE